MMEQENEEFKRSYRDDLEKEKIGLMNNLNRLDLDIRLKQKEYSQTPQQRS